MLLSTLLIVKGLSNNALLDKFSFVYVVIVLFDYEPHSKIK